MTNSVAQVWLFRVTGRGLTRTYDPLSEPYLIYVCIHLLRNHIIVVVV